MNMKFVVAVLQWQNYFIVKYTVINLLYEAISVIITFINR